MLRITRFTCENLMKGCVTDAAAPCFSYTLASDKNGACIKDALITINGWRLHTTEQIGILYKGPALRPFTVYQAVLSVVDTYGERAEAALSFETGRLAVPWEGRWISDGSYQFTEKEISPVPMEFCRSFSIQRKVVSARIYSTAMGIYELKLNGNKVGSDYFAPGFTSYRTHLQYQTYDVTAQLREENTLTAVVAGGWAVGAFVFTRKNRISADRQALLLELRITYADGTSEVVKTDESWLVTEEGRYQEASFYDGETYDASFKEADIRWRQASYETLRVSPKITAAYGACVAAHEQMHPISCTVTPEGLVYDFGQNFAGVVELTINGRQGQAVKVRHAEILKPDGTLNTAFLRTAKACVLYRCRDGRQTYSPRLTYMGFRYICVSGIEEADIAVSARALYSDLPCNGSFTCSDPMLNRLHENILWSAKSNFMDIPTDCPQRDERMGWTGDIAVFADTACYAFDMSRFFYKWLLDVQAEQLRGGGIPNTVPAQGYGFPATMPAMAIEFWGDACILVPWAEYMARGDIRFLEAFYPMMKKYVDACRFWASLFSVGRRRYIWHTPHTLHFGDWVAPDVPKMAQWQKRSKWTATASLKRTSGLLAQIAALLGKEADARKYDRISRKTARAYREVFSDGSGRMKEEFQTAYVLPVWFDIFTGEEKAAAAGHLVRLAEQAEYCIGTGFPGTPYILFALADNGHADAAYKMLLNTKCPSWLYEVKMGATTIWERFDGLDENGNCPIADDGTDSMVSYNHYASGAVGAFLYRRTAGIEPLLAGYRRFRIAPVIGGGIRSARACVETPYGGIVSDWAAADGVFTIQVQVPMGSTCELVLPDGTKRELGGGRHSAQVSMHV